MIDTSYLSVFYSFWTNTHNIEPLQVETGLSKYSYIVEMAQIGNQNYYILGSKTGEPILYFSINSEFSNNKIANDYQPDEIISSYKYHCDILMNPSNKLYSWVAAIDLLEVLSDLYKGEILDLTAQRIISKSEIIKMANRNSFKIEDFITLHFVEDEEHNTTWLHSHGMEKFELTNIETFNISKTNLLNARQLMMDLANAFLSGKAPTPNAPLNLPNGQAVLMYDSDVKEFLPDHLKSMIGVHKNPFYVLLDFDTASDINSVVKDYFFYKIAGKNASKLSVEEFNSLPQLPKIEFYVEFTITKQNKIEVLWGKLENNHQIQVLISPVFITDVFRNSLIPTNNIQIHFYLAYLNSKVLSYSELQNIS